jgi:hypothetical protein
MGDFVGEKKIKKERNYIDPVGSLSNLCQE